MHRLSPALPLALLAVLTLAAPVSIAQGTTSDHAVTISGYAFAPGAVTVNVGDTVTWHYAGPDTNHSVTTEQGQPETFDSDPGREPTSFDHLAGSTYRHTFTVAGVIHYFCKVHPGMRAAITVVGPEAPPVADTVKPALGVVGVTRRGGRTSLRLTLSEQARVTAVLRRGGNRLTVVRSLRKGTSSLRLPSGLRAGRYAVAVSARDAAGNVSATRRVAVTIPAHG
jgi:plastocyanin